MREGFNPTNPHAKKIDSWDDLASKEGRGQGFTKGAETADFTADKTAEALAQQARKERQIELLQKEAKERDKAIKAVNERIHGSQQAEQIGKILEDVDTDSLVDSTLEEVEGPTEKTHLAEELEGVEDDIDVAFEKIQKTGS